MGSKRNNIAIRGVLAVAGCFAAVLPAPPRAAGDEDHAAALSWQELAPLPDPIGFAGMFAGVSGDALVAAGGANFPEAPPWEGGVKRWHDRIFVLARPDGVWREVDVRLPAMDGGRDGRRAYGVALTWTNASLPTADHRAVVCIGGDDGPRHLQSCFLLLWNGRTIETRPLPALPRPCSQMCGAVLGDAVYIAGGIDAPEATTALRTFWRLDLSQPEDKRRWETLTSWPGLERMQAVAGAVGGAVYLAGGLRLQRGDDGKPQRVTPYLQDAYRFTPDDSPGGGAWERIADLPRPVAAPPAPALALDDSRLVVLGGVDGSLVGVPPEKHPGFKPDVFVYHARANIWRPLGRMPAGAARVTAPATVWRGAWVVVSGESGPGVRSPKVFAAKRALEGRAAAIE